MAFRIADLVVRGEIDNTQRGVVRGRVWLNGQDSPLEFELAGDCWRDLAGCRCRFTNPKPERGSVEGLSLRQTGEVGDITASHKVRVPVGPVDEWCVHSRLGQKPPERLANSLYLEWYSDTNGRVVIESADFELDVSLPEWAMTEAEEARQRELNGEAMLRFLNRLEAALQPKAPVEVPEDRDMDEFEWERFLRQADAKTERFGELLDKFREHPDQERIVARHMGWDGLVEALDAAEAAEQDPDDAPAETFEDDDDLPPEPEPDPEREGIDWIRTKHGDIRHPLQHRCFELGIRMHFDAKAHGYQGEDNRAPDVADMAFKVQCTSAKLAGALDPATRGEVWSAGFTVANLKRALGLLHEAMSALERIEAQKLLPELTPGYREELHTVREGIIDLMNRYRAEVE